MINKERDIIEKIWGHEEICTNNELYCSKILHLKKDFRCSVHCHKIKDETFYIIDGKIKLELYKLSSSLAPALWKSIEMNPGQSIRIEPGLYHRFTGLFLNNTILEVSTTDKKEDSYRLTQSEEVPENERNGRVSENNYGGFRQHYP